MEQGIRRMVPVLASSRVRNSSRLICIHRAERDPTDSTMMAIEAASPGIASSPIRATFRDSFPPTVLGMSPFEELVRLQGSANAVWSIRSRSLIPMRACCPLGGTTAAAAAAIWTCMAVVEFGGRGGIGIPPRVVEEAMSIDPV